MTLRYVDAAYPVDQKALAASKLIALLKDSFETVLRRRSTALALHPLRDDSLAAGAFWSTSTHEPNLLIQKSFWINGGCLISLARAAPVEAEPSNDTGLDAVNDRQQCLGFRVDRALRFRMRQANTQPADR